MPDAALDALTRSGLLQSPRRTADGGPIKGDVVVEGRATTLSVVPPGRPSARPTIRLSSETALGRIPHVEQNGKVCYQSDEGLVLDRYRPDAVLAESVRLALDVLADGVTGRNHADFADEWETYWSPLCIQRYAFVGPVPDGLCRLAVAERSERRKRKRDRPSWIGGYVGRSEADIAAFYNGAPYTESHTTRGALYVPLPGGTVLVPPTETDAWTPARTRRLLRDSLAPDGLATLDRALLKRRHRKAETVVVALPRPSGGLALFGLRFSGVRDAHPLLPTGTASAVRPVQIDRWDPGYLAPRGGGHAGLSGRHVVVVGCGAVGGHLAFELARAGVTRLTLVDPDLLLPDNTFRHVLGREFWGLPKVSALKTALERHTPYLQVTAVEAEIDDTLNDASVDPTQADLVVLATGAPSVEREVNARLWQAPSAPPALVTWLEPLGLGGHAVLMRPGHGPGCLECLFTPPTDSGHPLHNRAAFAAPDQDFSRATAGCGSLHTPYASADALHTASLAARLATDALLGHEPDSPLRSWKGDPRPFLDAGFQATPRFHTPAEALDALRLAYHAPACPVCAPDRA